MLCACALIQSSTATGISVAQRDIQQPMAVLPVSSSSTHGAGEPVAALQITAEARVNYSFRSFFITRIRRRHLFNLNLSGFTSCNAVATQRSLLVMLLSHNIFVCVSCYKVAFTSGRCVRLCLSFVGSVTNGHHLCCLLKGQWAS